MNDLLNRLNAAEQIYLKGDHFNALNIIEQLLEVYPNEYLQILNKAYHFYQNLTYKDRYHLYQGRYFDFNIQPGEKVLDIGSGNVPFPFATHLADLTIHDDKYGRAGQAFKYIEGRPVFECDIENLPFGDKEFDFIYCSHVLEHVENPAKACNELMRTGKRGYIETPAKVKDLWFNNAKVSNHIWSIDTFKNKLIFRRYTQEEIDGISCNLMQDMHINPSNDKERAVHATVYLKAHLINTMLYWHDSFEYEVME